MHSSGIKIDIDEDAAVFPIADENSGYNKPAVVTILLILANVAVFVFLQGLGSNDQFTYAFATVPQEIVTGHDIARTVTIADPITGDTAGRIALERTPIPVYLTIFTAMFMHGGLAHLFGNMLFLWIFGDNLEHVMGRGRFLLFYLVCGVAAAVAQVALTVMSGGNQLIPMIGASGAISGVLGGYLVLFPSRRVRVFMSGLLLSVPAFVALGMWFVFQLISGMGVLGNESQVGGVAYAAHIGGFVAGLILVKLFAKDVDSTGGPAQRVRELENVRW